ncbi:podocalyxin-like protein 2 [Zonotrichia albicollis]|uniref:podocalyxin-like protein 2 n=1 Tax=Zonotrichia albicollis TaxID=44394 RepID=UPI003D80E3E3
MRRVSALGAVAAPELRLPGLCSPGLCPCCRAGSGASPLPSRGLITLARRKQPRRRHSLWAPGPACGDRGRGRRPGGRRLRRQELGANGGQRSAPGPPLGGQCGPPWRLPSPGAAPGGGRTGGGGAGRRDAERGRAAGGRGGEGQSPAGGGAAPLPVKRRCGRAAAAAMQPLHRAPALLLLLLLAAGTLCLCLASSEDPTADGLTSTSLLEFAMMSHLEAMNSHEQARPEAAEPDLAPGSLHAAPGSGFASEENEESKILQPPQYFWEDGGELNDSSLDLGPATDYTFPASSQKALPKQNGTQADNWEMATVQPPAEFVEPDLHTPFSTLEEEEGLLPIDHSRGGMESLQTSGPEVTSSEPVDQEDSFSLPFSTASARPGVVTEAAIGGQEEDSVSPGLDLGSSMGPGLLPVPSTFSTTVAARSPIDSEELLEVTTGDTWAVGGADSELAVATTGAEPAETTVEAGGEEHSAREEVSEPTVGWEMLEPTVLTEMEQTVETPVGTPSPAGSSPGTQTTPGSEQQPSSVSLWDRADEPELDPLWNDTEPATETAAAGRSSSPPPGDARMAMLPTELPWDSAQVICKDWSNLAGKNYIILNMSDNIDCEEFRLERGPQLLALVEDAFSRQAEGLQDRWLISLSKPNENDKHLLMTLAGEQGVIPTKDVLMALGDVKRSLAEIGIQNYSTTTSCQSHPNQTRSDYGKLFVVLVIIGSICAIIIVLGLIYNCWQRRLPKMKNMSHGEELRFVENGCHDNPTLDVASDSQSEMQEKKPSVNGGNTINGPDSWDVLINKQASEDVDVFEEDTHL